VRILLDECLPVRLAREISGHDVRTVPGVGWAGVKNGELLLRAAQEFQAFVTIDQRLTAAVETPSSLSIVTLKARSNRLDDLLPLVSGLLVALETITPGQRISIGD
jgi:hypothetical protein